MKIITIMNQNGGVAKTHTATNLAHGIGKKGFKVLLIDADPQATSTDTVLQIGNEFRKQEIEEVRKMIKEGIPKYRALEQVVSKPSPEYDLADVFDDPDIIEEAIYTTQNPNVDIIASSMKLDNTDMKIRDDRTRSNITILSDALKNVEAKYDFVILDEAPRSDNITSNSLIISDLVIIPIKTDRKSMKGFLRTIKSMLLIQKRNKVDFDFKLLLQMVNKNRNDKSLIEFYQSEFADDVFKQTIRFQAKPISDADFNNTYVIENEKSNVAKDYMNFIDEVLDYFNQKG